MNSNANSPVSIQGGEAVKIDTESKDNSVPTGIRVDSNKAYQNANNTKNTSPPTQTRPSTSMDSPIAPRKKSVTRDGRNRLKKRQSAGAELGTTRATKDTEAPMPSLSANSTTSVARTENSKDGHFLSTDDKDVRRDSGLGPTSPCANTPKPPNGSIRQFSTHNKKMEAKVNHSEETGSNKVNVPVIVVREEPDKVGTDKIGCEELQNGEVRMPASQTSLSVGLRSEAGNITTQRITTDIPTESLEGLFDGNKLQFSNRGSLLVRDPEAHAALSALADKNTHQSTLKVKKETTKREAAPNLSQRVLSDEEIILSRKIRAMYEHGDEKAGQLAFDLGVLDDDVISEAAVTEDGYDTPSTRPDSPLNVRKPGKVINTEFLQRPASGNASRRCSMITKAPSEIAGGLEDWNDVSAQNVDRYGFIVKSQPNLSSISVNSHNSTETSSVYVDAATSQTANEGETQKSSLKHALSSRGKRKPKVPSHQRKISDAKSHSSHKAGAPSIRSFQSDHSTSAGLQSHFWQATGHLLPNRRKRVVNTANQMLFSGSANGDDGCKSPLSERERTRKEQEARTKEWRREEKWRKMARLVSKGERGGGMEFDFNTLDPNVINRVWKGIPDRWRASAWYCFLADSAKRRKDCASHDELVQRFHELQDENGADDGQIDVDVPRTISGHIMFRRRYRGGQRLLFRALHALSLYFPETGYVQGMASLAATLLCYYDEENSFVMLVRMWQLRGLKHLYESGFGGLMEALEQFERDWLRNGDVANKLYELGVSSTAYGTRWYLTLFNYSVPFAAQLRVWDVFMLLGDPIHNKCDSANVSVTGADIKLPPHISAPSPSSTSASRTAYTTSFESAENASTKSALAACDLDVLHATSAAIIDASRDTLVHADFENAMKVLTSWVPIQNEDLFMRVVKVEWKERKRRLEKGS